MVATFPDGQRYPLTTFKVKDWIEQVATEAKKCQYGKKPMWSATKEGTKEYARIAVRKDALLPSSGKHILYASLYVNGCTKCSLNVRRFGGGLKKDGSAIVDETPELLEKWTQEGLDLVKQIAIYFVQTPEFTIAKIRPLKDQLEKPIRELKFDGIVWMDKIKD
jgi:hypothetical protein